LTISGKPFGINLISFLYKLNYFKIESFLLSCSKVVLLTILVNKICPREKEREGEIKKGKDRERERKREREKERERKGEKGRERERVCV
jgi:hypothetical protein